MPSAPIDSVKHHSAHQLGVVVVCALAKRLRYLVKHLATGRDVDVKSEKGQQGFGVEVHGCSLFFCPGGQQPLFCARLITSRASSAARAVAVFWSARWPSTVANNSASLAKMQRLRTHFNPLQLQVIALRQRVAFWPRVLELVFVFNPIQFFQVT